MFLADIIDNLIAWDRKTFSCINSRYTNGFFDAILPLLRESLFWIPFYLFLLVFALQNFGKYKWWWVGLALLTVSLTDIVSSRLIKHAVQRLRPCNDPLMINTIRLLLNYCSGGYSFTSSHAANHFGIATFIYLTCKQYSKWIILIFVWAFIIAYAQIYVGVHYPLDVLGGIIAGLLLGCITANIYNKIVNKNIA